MTQPLYIAFVWHMHQPYYRDLATGQSAMPWVRLHAAKDYVDMVKRLEEFPTIHQTFNIVPSLVDQLEEYLPPRNQSDAFLEVSRKPAAALSEQDQRFVLQWFFLANVDRMIKPYPRYHDLLAKRGVHFNDEDWPIIQKRFHTQDYLDLQVWFNLAWIDPWLRHQDPVLKSLETKGAQFSEEEKLYVLEAHLALLSQVIPIYRSAAQQGRIELTTSPYYHPIMPLLCDLRTAHVALPQLRLPERTFRHPEDARWHLQQGLARHHEAFGQQAQGLWPPEGSVSEEFVKLAMESGLRWIATDEEILWRTLKTSRAPSILYRPHLLRRKGGQLAIVFRDRELSDLIGFVYSQWDPKVAVADFIKRLGEISQQFRSAVQPALVSIILDGENAWESYANDGHDFFMGLYAALANDGRFRCVTVSEFLDTFPVDQTESLPELFSGSWIDGNFSTWVGHPEKNAAWQALSETRDALASMSREDPRTQQAWKSLGIAEGSDWMWWFGETHFSAQAMEFDQLFRAHLANAYHFSGLEVPPTLQTPIRRQTASPIYAPTGIIHPTVDGRETSYYEWLYAGRFDLTQQYSAMHRGAQGLRRLYYGFDETFQYLRLDVDPGVLVQLPSWTVTFDFAQGVHICLIRNSTGVRADVIPQGIAKLLWSFDRLFELAIPLTAFGLSSEHHNTLELAVTFSAAEEVLERYPTQGTLALTTSLAELESQNWVV